MSSAGTSRVPIAGIAPSVSATRCSARTSASAVMHRVPSDCGCAHRGGSFVRTVTEMYLGLEDPLRLGTWLAERGVPGQDLRAGGAPTSAQLEAHDRASRVVARWAPVSARGRWCGRPAVEPTRFLEAPPQEDGRDARQRGRALAPATSTGYASTIAAPSPARGRWPPRAGRPRCPVVDGRVDTKQVTAHTGHRRGAAVRSGGSMRSSDGARHDRYPANGLVTGVGQQPRPRVGRHEPFQRLATTRDPGSLERLVDSSGTRHTSSCRVTARRNRSTRSAHRSAWPVDRHDVRECAIAATVPAGMVEGCQVLVGGRIRRRPSTSLHRGRTADPPRRHRGCGRG